MAPLPCKSLAFGEGSPAKPDWGKEKGYWWADDPKTGMHDQKPSSLAIWVYLPSGIP